jgi:hypothetical protein
MRQGKEKEKQGRRRVQTDKSAIAPPIGVPSWCLNESALKKLNRSNRDVRIYDYDTDDRNNDSDDENEDISGDERRDNDSRESRESREKRKKQKKKEKKQKKKSKK